MNRRLIMVLILIPLCIKAIADDKQTKPVLNLPAFIKLACNHGTFKEILIQELSLNYSRILDTPQIELLLETTASYAVTLDTGGENHFTGGLTLSSLFPASGTTVAAEYNTGRSAAGNLQSSTISLKVEQEVLNNAFGSTNRLLELMAGNEMSLARYQILETYEDYLTEVIDIYIEWYAAYENMLYAEKSLADSRTLLNLTRQKRQYNVALPIDVNKSTLQVLIAEEQLNKAQNTFDTLQKRVAMLTGSDIRDFSYIPANPVISANNLDLEAEKDKFMSQSRTAKMLDLLLTINRQELDIALDKLLPTAKVYAAYNVSGSEYLPAKNQSNELELGFSMGVPLLNTTAKAEADLQKNILEKTILSQANQKENLNFQLSNLHASITFLSKQLALSEQKLTLARLIVKDEETRYNQGRSGLDDVLKAYDTLNSINQSRLAVVVELNKSYFEWLRFTDTLIAENKQITIEKSMLQE